VRHRLGLATRTQISVCKSPFPSADTAVSLFCAKTVVTDVQVTSVFRNGDSGDIQQQPHRIFAVNTLLDDAVRAAINITKPGLFHSASIHH